MFWLEPFCLLLGTRALPVATVIDSSINDAFEHDLNPGSSPQDAQSPSEDEDDCPLWRLADPLLKVPTQNRFEGLLEDSSSRSVKQRVDRESTTECDPQQSTVLDVLEFDFTVADSDTASVSGDSESQQMVQDSSGEQPDDHDRIPRRKLSIVGFPQARHDFLPSDQHNDTDDDDEVRERDGASECEEAVPFAPVEDPTSGEVQARNISVGLQSLDEVDLREVFMMRPIIMKSVPPFMRSCLKSAMRLAGKTVVQGRMVNNVELETQG